MALKLSPGRVPSNRGHNPLLTGRSEVVTSGKDAGPDRGKRSASCEASAHAATPTTRQPARPPAS